MNKDSFVNQAQAEQEQNYLALANPMSTTKQQMQLTALSNMNNEDIMAYLFHCGVGNGDILSSLLEHVGGTR